MLLFCLLAVVCRAAHYSFKVPANSGDGRCSSSNVTSFIFNTTISSPGAIAVFALNSPAFDYWKGRADLTPLSSIDNNTQFPVPFPPMSCFNPANSATNKTLYTTCNGENPPGFNFDPPQKMCVLVKNDQSNPLDVTLDATWPDSGDAQKKSGGSLSKRAFLPVILLLTLIC